jgi:DNA-binding helix-hairpin-helix protein with protein kinase domain
MDGRLAPGTIVHLPNHKIDCKVIEYLGSGGQGEVYRVTASAGAADQSLALKWYFPEWSTDQHWSDLLWLTKQAPPSAAFLWPIDVAVAADRRQARSFGYVMRLRPEHFRGSVGVVAGKLEISFSVLVTACMRLADAFLSLHADGLCYRDISFGNVFIDPASGEVLICDNDNVAINQKGSVGIRGTDKFMAPEIVRGEAQPSIATDLYSLSVLLFYLLLIGHPLEGRRMGQHEIFGREEAVDLYGKRPLFIFDPADASNAPADHAFPWTYWAIFPRFLRDLFIRAFTEGLSDPEGGRVREGEWRDAFGHLLDLLIRCRCGAQVFVEPNGQPVAPVCWKCHEPPTGGDPLLMLTLDSGGERHTVALNVGRRLFAHHLRGRRYDFREISAEVVRHPEAPDVIGLRNLSSDTWFATAGEGPQRTDVSVQPLRSVNLAPGMRITFGSATGVVES